MTTKWTKCALLAVALLAATGISAASSGDARMPAQLVLPSATLARTGNVPVAFKLSQGFTGHATLHLHWTDSLGRVVEDKTLPFDLTDETKINFFLDMSHALAMSNHLQVDVSLSGKDVKGASYDRDESAGVDFVARPPYTGWKDYVIMMWQPYPVKLIPELKQVGVDGGTYSSRDVTLPKFLIDTNTRWYSESLATDYYSTYHIWRPDRPYDWTMDQARALYKKDPGSLAAFKRHPSFEDPYWVKLVHDRGVATGKRLAPYRPYFYSLADESGIATLESQWDFDFSDMSLAPMRRWLKMQYGSLGALNSEWGTQFTDWNLVMPETTNQAMQRPGDNFAQWADFKTWMDITYADALKMGADAIREGDPHAYVGVGGSQMPGWGGYDYARMTKALTLMEPYDIGRSVDVAHSLNPRIVLLSTGFGSSPNEEHRVWYELLHGERGLIVWDEKHAYVQPDGTAGPGGVAVGKYYNEIRDGEGALILNSRAVNNAIAVHYSQPSMRTQWMLERRPDGAAWMTREASYERTHNNFMRLRLSWCEMIEDQGLQPHFVSYMQLPKGALLKGGFHVLVLPESSSLSLAEAAAIRSFIAEGGIAISDGVPGTYDQHSRKLDKSPLADLFGESPTQKVNVHPYGAGKAILLHVNMVDYLTSRLEQKEGPVHTLIENLLRENGVHPAFAVEDAAGNTVVGVDTHVYANGGIRIVALQSNPQMRVSELGPPDFRSNKRFKSPITVHLHLPNAMYVYDTRAHKSLGRHTELTLAVDPFQPTILAASDTPLPGLHVSLPDHAARGSLVRVAVDTPNSPADTSVFHISVRDPNGKQMVFYSGNILAHGGSGMRSIPLASNDVTGTWTVTVRDILSGQSVTNKLDVE